MNRFLAYLLLLLVADALGLTGLIRAQSPPSSLMNWGVTGYDTELVNGPIVKIDARYHATLVLRADGRVFGSGADGISNAPLPPPGKVFVDIEAGYGMACALLSDGSVWRWAWDNVLETMPVPVPPAGVTYTDVACCSDSYAALRSDGMIVVWGRMAYGQDLVPALPPNTHYVSVEGGAFNLIALRSDGQLVAWGYNSVGQCNVPSLPPGVTYVKVSAGGGFTVALRSNGTAVAFGDNTSQQCNVPALPNGVTYVDVAAGTVHALALRSDGQLVGWGDTTWARLLDIPTPPPGQAWSAIAAGYLHNVGLLSNGTIVGWGGHQMYQHGLPVLDPGERWTQLSSGTYHTLGLDSRGQLLGFGADTYGVLSAIPTLPSGVRWRKVGAGYIHDAGLLSDGTAVAWPTGLAQSAIPSLPPGLTYVDLAVSEMHTLLLRSDGIVVGVGNNSVGECLLPALPQGVTYVAIDADVYRSVALRSDGNVVSVGDDYSHIGTNIPPPLPPGFVYVEAAAGRYQLIVRRCDGEVMVVGAAFHSQFGIPNLPWGVHWVEVDGFWEGVILRSSDGRCAVALNGFASNLNSAPDLGAGRSYVEVSATAQQFAARVGPTSTYVSFAPGCAGSQQPARLVPMDTPRIDKVHEVNVFDLPQNVAFMLFGWSRTAPQSLQSYGMPGCNAHVTADGAYLLLGQSGWATYRLPIPNVPGLVGLHFYNQAVVLDPQAGNVLGAVMSEAAEGVVGHW